MVVETMRRTIIQRTWLLLVALLTVTFETNFVLGQNGPEFVNPPTVLTLYESTSVQTILTTLSCADPDGDKTVVSLLDVNPKTTCGGCFGVFPCSLGDWCLGFLPSQGTLDYSQVSSYDIDVECEDATGARNDTTVEVRIIFNTPPQFDPNVLYTSTSVSNTKGKDAGDLVIDLDATDADGDPVFFTMTSTPQSDNFEIGYTDGKIRAKYDLVAECRSSITFSVNISDGVNPPVGPHTVHVDLQNSNVAPDITNLDKSIQVTEDTAVGDSIATIVTNDDTPNKVTYTMTANPTANMAYFEVTASGEIRVKSSLNFELSSARNTNLTIVADDGACTSAAHYLYVTITDVNEQPQIYPKDAAYDTYEGQIAVSPPWNVIDPDYNDQRTYTIIDGNTFGRFRIDQSTGQIFSTVNYDVDNGAMPSTVTLRIQVTDKGGLSDNTTVTLQIHDANDNRPIITSGDHDFTVCNRNAGGVLATLQCTDEDSSYEQNNETYFGGSGGGVTIGSSGEIILNTVPAVGQTLSGTAYCYDRGKYPNSLQSAPYYITVTGRECTTVAPVTRPTAAPTTTRATTTTTTTTTTPAPSTENTIDWLDENLPWIIAAAILATLLLGLIMYMILVYCWKYCLRCCRQPWCKRTPKPERLKTPPRKVKPATPPKPAPTPVVGPQNGYLHDFWKEKYPDNDYGKQPDRNTVPRPVTPVDNSFSLEDAAPAAPKKKRFCTIL